MAENYKHLYEQMKKMVAMYQDEIVPGMREQVEKRVEVVRCKDCEYGDLDNVSRYRSLDGEMDEAGKYKCCYSWTINHWYDGDHFCSDGKRKNDENS